MKTLNLHCDYIKFKGLKKALKKIEEIVPDQTLEGESKDCLVVLVAVEKGDKVEVVSKLVEDVKKISKDVKAENIVLYPYAHLSKNLGKPETAIEILDEAEKVLKKDFNVVKAPFGYYKEFEMKVKGHPLSELSRDFVVGGNDEEESDEIKDIDEDQRKKLLRQITKAKLDTSKLADNDHRIIGRKMDLWSFSSAAPGMPFWHHKGLHIRNKLEQYWKEVHRMAGYELVSTPQIMDRKLWEVSGHWSKYSENNFKTEYEKRDFLVKPMNCPGGMLIYQTSPKSYNDLPLKSAELGLVHRVELSGVLSGLFRVIQFTQDDAHIFCTEEQFEEEISKVMDLAKEVYSHFGLTIDHIELSTRPEKRIGREELWDLAEESLERLLKKKKVKFIINKGDGAFYGPKIDYHVKDSLGRTWQCATIQLDMALPERFELTYTDNKGKEKRPIMVHRTIYGSFERFIGMLTESYNGNFPLWISPNQVKVMTLNDDVADYAREVYDKLFKEGFEVELNDKSESMGKKAREAQVQRFNYLVTVGENEKKSGKISVRSRENKELIEMSVDEFVEKLKSEIKENK